MIRVWQAPEITTHWADIVTLTDGRSAFPACALLVAPSSASIIDDASIAPLLPTAGAAM